MKIQDIFSKVRLLAPEEYQCDWDNCGVQVNGTVRDVSKVAVALEPTEDTIYRCLDWGAEVVVTHHPYYMKPVAPNWDNKYTRILRRLMQSGAWLYSCHTSLDARPDGPAVWIGKEFGLTNTSFLERSQAFAPTEVFFHLQEPVSRDEAEMWANRDGVLAMSQNNAGEFRVICEHGAWDGVAEAIEFSLGAQPVYYTRELAGPLKEVGLGQAGDLPKPLSWDEFQARLAAMLGVNEWRVSGPIPDQVKRIAMCSGSGGSLVDQARKSGADVYITGDMKYHLALDADMCVVDIGHFIFEEIMMQLYAEELAEIVDDVEVKFFEGVEPFKFHG